MGEDIKDRASVLPFRPPFFYGWVTISTFIDSYISEFGWSRSTVSGMYSVGTLTAGLLMGLVGNFFDKRGHRLMTPVLAILLGLACLFMSYVNTPVTLLAGFLSIRLLGQGSMSLSSNTLVPQWFIRKRGRALSLTSLGGAMSSATFPIINTWIIQTCGWRAGWRTWSILLWIVMAPIAYFMTRNSPEDVGLSPDGEEKVDVEKGASAFFSEVNWTAREAMGTRSFWLLLFCLMIPSAIGTGLIFHQVSIMNRVGVSVEAAAGVLSIMALIRLPLVLVAGQIADRIPPRYLQTGSMVGLLISMIALYFTGSIQMAMFYGILIGITMTFQILVGGVIWPEYYGRSNLGSIRGMTMMAGVIGSALGPLSYGLAYDLYGGYREVLVFSMVFPILGIIAALMATPPKK
jgi:sugar phosphate permease